jgi:hypothetical protein
MDPKRAGKEVGAMSTRTAPRAHSDERTEPDHDGSGNSGAKAYVRFAAMIATSTMVMFGLTYTNSYALDHVRWSEERVYMALLMGGAMSVIMLGFMWRMHGNRRANVGILVAGFAVMGVALFLSRTQQFVDDREYMKGMIPHHSIAVLTSEHSDIDDLRVCDLASSIIRSQREEIAEMDWLIDDIARNDEAATRAEADRRAVPTFTADDVRDDC